VSSMHSERGDDDGGPRIHGRTGCAGRQGSWQAKHEKDILEVNPKEESWEK